MIQSCFSVVAVADGLSDVVSAAWDAVVFFFDVDDVSLKYGFPFDHLSVGSHPPYFLSGFRLTGVAPVGPSSSTIDTGVPSGALS